MHARYFIELNSESTEMHKISVFRWQSDKIVISEIRTCVLYTKLILLVYTQSGGEYKQCIDLPVSSDMYKWCELMILRLNIRPHAALVPLYIHQSPVISSFRRIPPAKVISSWDETRRCFRRNAAGLRRNFVVSTSPRTRLTDRRTDGRTYRSAVWYVAPTLLRPAKQQANADRVSVAGRSHYQSLWDVLWAHYRRRRRRRNWRRRRGLAWQTTSYWNVIDTVVRQWLQCNSCVPRAQQQTERMTERPTERAGGRNALSWMRKYNEPRRAVAATNCPLDPLRPFCTSPAWRTRDKLHSLPVWPYER